jgi:hypothetical protein
MAVTNEEIQAFLAANPNMSDAEIVRSMMQYGVMPEQMIQATGADPTAGMQRINAGEAALRTSMVEGGQNVGGYTNQEIQSFLASNPNMSDSDIAFNMMRYGVSPDQMIQATGMSPTEGMQRFGTALEQLGIPQTGIAGRESAMNRGLQSALASLASGNQQASAGINTGRDLATGQAQAAFGQGRGFFQPYEEGGRQAFNQQLALSGAQGQDAFNQANMESPYVQYLQEQGERAVTRNASALGGLGSGRVQQELMRQGQGLAGQGLQQQFQNLNALSGMGLSAASGMAGLSGTEGQVVPGITTQAARDIANMQNQYAQQAAQMQFGAGQFTAQGRTDAGNLLAGNQALTAQQLASLAENQGRGMSDIYGVGTGNLANLLSGYGQAGAGLGMTGAGQYSSMNPLPQRGQTPGMLGEIGQFASGVGTVMMASDYRLKDNITPTGSVNGINHYMWEWKPEFSHITQGMPTSGVIAQEVAQTHPEAVSLHDSGFLFVDYSKVN